MKKESLAERITSVLVTTPAQVDIEDDFEDNAISVLNTNIEDIENVKESNFRKKNVNLLADVDSRYGGVTESRKSLNYQESDVLDEFENNTESESATSNEGTDDELQQDYDSDQDSVDSSLDELQEYESDQDSELTENSHPIGKFKSTNDEDVLKDFKKGQCVKNQMALWEFILEMRIQMQKSLLAANKMPQYEYYRNMKNACGQDFTNSVKDTKKSLSALLNKLLLLQKLLWDRCPEINKIQKQNNNPDDEILSGSDEEENEDEIKNSTPTKKMKLSEFESDLKEKNDTYKTYRDHVIKKWHEKIRITSTNNNANVLPIISHIEHVLTDKDKLIRKTQLRRTTYKIIGENIENDADKTNLEGSVAVYNKEIFDDDDFYHQLLRELIEFKSADLTDPVQLSRRWMQLQSLRNKMKRKIDTKATKGRKIRYDIHKKLVHFVSPIVDNMWSDEAKTELFSSLFGKTNI